MNTEPTDADQYMTCKMPASLQNVAQLRRWLDQALIQLEVSPACRDDFKTAISELASNAVLHPQPPAQEFQVSLHKGPQELMVEFCSDAHSFRDSTEMLKAVKPLQEIDPTATSGRGLGIVQRLFPRVEYHAHATHHAGMECYRLQRISTLCQVG